MHIIRLIETAADATDVAPSTMGRKCSGSGDLYRRLRDGHDITVRRAARITHWFSDHWPAEAEWPSDVPRPEPSPGSPASSEPEPPSDPLAAVEEALDRLDAAMTSEPADWDAASRHEAEAFRAAMTLRGDGRVASVDAVCRALHVPRHTYDDVVRRFSDGRGGSRPREGSRAFRVLALLVASGDVRFSERELYTTRS